MSYNIAGIDVYKKMLIVVVADIEVEGEYRLSGAGLEPIRSSCKPCARGRRSTG